MNEHIDSVIRDLPNRKEEFITELEAAKQAGLTDVSEFKLHMNIIHSVMHDIRHESVMIFAKYSHSKHLNEVEFGEMMKVIENRNPEIGAVVNSLQWI